jgi:hypothetical protein
MSAPIQIHTVNADYLDAQWRHDDILTESDALADEHGTGDFWMQELPGPCPRCDGSGEVLEELVSNVGELLHSLSPCDCAVPNLAHDAMVARWVASKRSSSLRSAA